MGSCKKRAAAKCGACAAKKAAAKGGKCGTKKCK